MITECDHDSHFIDDFGGHWRCLRCGQHTCIAACTVIAADLEELCVLVAQPNVTYELAGQSQKARVKAIETAAEAIYIADEENPEPDWTTLPKFGKRHYLKMAAAAYEVLIEAVRD